MNITIIKQMQENFDRMLSKDIPGQNHDCWLIDTFGHDGDATARSYETRCVCYADARQDKPVFRTSLNTPIHQGMLVYLNDTEDFYLLKEPVHQASDCYQTVATPCNAQITVTTIIPAKTDENGYLIQEEEIGYIVRNIPCVTSNTPALANGGAGLVIDGTMHVALQLNRFTKSIAADDKFVLDGQTYVIYAVTIDGDVKREHGIMTLMCKRAAGGQVKA